MPATRWPISRSTSPSGLSGRTSTRSDNAVSSSSTSPSWRAGDGIPSERIRHRHPRHRPGRGGLDRVEDEVFQVGRAVEASPDLRQTLSDPRLPLERRQAIVNDLLGNRVAPVTMNAISMVVAARQGATSPTSPTNWSHRPPPPGSGRWPKCAARFRSTMPPASAWPSRWVKGDKAERGGPGGCGPGGHRGLIRHRRRHSDRWNGAPAAGEPARQHEEPKPTR